MSTNSNKAFNLGIVLKELWTCDTPSLACYIRNIMISLAIVMIGAWIALPKIGFEFQHEELNYMKYVFLVVLVIAGICQLSKKSCKTCPVKDTCKKSVNTCNKEKCKASTCTKSKIISEVKAEVKTTTLTPKKRVPRKKK